MKFLSRETTVRLRETYTKGLRVELVQMDNDPYSTLRPGDRGTVDHVDDSGTIFVKWDSGSGLGCLWKIDHLKIIKD